MPEYSLFNAMDQCLVDVDDDAFGESLLLNILFQEQTLVNESFFFNSTRLASHMEHNRGRISLFELGCRSGAIVPALSDGDSVNLDDAEKVMRRKYGHEFELTAPEMRVHVAKLKAAVEFGLQTTPPFYWPSEEAQPLDVGYLNILRRLLQQPEPPLYAYQDISRVGWIEQIWEKSKCWRYDLIENASRSSDAGGKDRIRRSVLYNMLGHSLGVPSANKTVSVSDILAACSDPQTRTVAEIFTKWTTQCHHINQAQCFKTAINFPVYNIQEDFAIDSLIRSPLDSFPNDGEDGFRCEVELPTLGLLLEADAHELVAIRMDLGQGYLKMLKTWQQNPTTANREYLVNQLKDYCKNICVKYENLIRNKVIVNSVSTAERWIDKIKDPSVTLLPLLICVPGIGAAIKYSIVGLSHLARNRRIQRQKPRARELEITLPSDAASY